MTANKLSFSPFFKSRNAFPAYNNFFFEIQVAQRDLEAVVVIRFYEIDHFAMHDHFPVDPEEKIRVKQGF